MAAHALPGASLSQLPIDAVVFKPRSVFRLEFGAVKYVAKTRAAGARNNEWGLVMIPKSIFVSHVAESVETQLFSLYRPCDFIIGEGSPRHRANRAIQLIAGLEKKMA